MNLRTHRGWHHWTYALALSAALLNATVTWAGAAALPAPDLQELADEAYVYAYPMVLMDATRRVATTTTPQAGFARAPVNRFAHFTSFPDASFEAVVRPNADTLYSSMWFDVRHEPLLISVPDTKGRYYLLQMMDMWSDVFASPGSRTTGNGAQTMAIVAPGWQGTLPAGTRVYVAPTPEGWVLGRTQTNGVADYAAVHAFQAAMRASPLSQWHGKGEAPPAAREAGGQDQGAPVAQVDAMAPERFFSAFSRLLTNNPPHFNDAPQIDRLARLGIVPGAPLDWAALPEPVQAALTAAPKNARARIAAAVRSAGLPSNGWRIIHSPIGTYGTDYLRRAVVAFAGLGANTVEDAIYPFAFADAAGRPLDSGARYVLHFEKSELPPVRAFWSLTLYNERQFFAANPINRYAIGDRDALKFNADGSLDLYIQRDPPERDRVANWLPAPASGGFSLNLRLYWPESSVLLGEWKPPPLLRRE